MVKKHKGGRRQILQLEDKKQPSRESEPSSSASSVKDECPLDSQVADFFKEINALSVNNDTETDNSEVVCAPSDIPSCSKQKDSEESNSLDELPEKNEGYQEDGSKADLGNYCPWQEICDENTGYNYYWNVETNEVTWECPAEYIIYLNSMHPIGSEDFSQSNESNSDGNHIKSKKKKDALQPPEGHIIPISYFGGSSSEDSSDEEKENGFGTTSDLLNSKEELNVTASSKKTSRSKNKTEQCVEMGPHLPDENTFSKTVSSAAKSCIPLTEDEMNTKNEVEEYLEIGPQLSSNCGMDLPTNLDLNADCNTVSDSTAKCASVSDCIKNGPSDASSSTVGDSWELSLKIIEREFKGLDQDVGEDSPDSTVKRSDNFSENNVPSQTSNEIIGVRRVVEYNFTDDEDEEEMSSSNISSSKEESITAHKVLSSEYKVSREESSCEQKKCDSKSKVSQSESQQKLFKRKFRKATDRFEDLNIKKLKQKNNIDFDKIFNNHGNNGKYGFGFNRKEQLNLESEFSCSTSSHSHLSHGKSSNDYKSINFVKSDHIFDLNILNTNVPNDNVGSNLSETEEAADKEGESIYVPEPSDLNLMGNVENSEEILINESKFVCNENTDTSNFMNNSSAFPSNAEPKSLCEKDEAKDVSSYKKNNLLKVDEDIDEIDRQLSEALEAKKVENIVLNSSSSSPVNSPRADLTETDSYESELTKIESTNFLSNAASSESLSDNILNLSSLLIDKLTFLVTNNSALTAFTSLLIQIQTRLMDWQASALDSRYFMCRLQEIEQYLHHYEIGAASGDWVCQWDRENKRYFYLNNRTQRSQWSYPEELYDKESSWMPSSTDLATTSLASSEQSLEKDELQTVSSSVPEGQFNNRSTNDSNKDTSVKYSDSSSMWILESSPPPPPPGVESPPPPPPPESPPPDSPPPPPPDSTEVEDLLEDMDIDDSDDSNQTSIVSNREADKPTDAVTPYSKSAILSPERTFEKFLNTSVTNAVSSTSLSSFEDMNTVSKSPQLVSTSHDTVDTADSVNMHWSVSQPSCSTDIASNFDSENEVNIMTNPKLLLSDKECDTNATSSTTRSCEVNTSSTSSNNCDINASSTSSKIYSINASSSSSRNCDVNSNNYINSDVNSSSNSYINSDINASSSSYINSDINASSSSCINSDIDASSSSYINCDINASTSSYINSDVISNSSSYRNCDVNTSSSSYSSNDVNASSSSCKCCDGNASSSTSKSYICSIEITYQKNGGPYPSTSVSPSTTSSKKEKKKTKLSSGLALKKKNIPSLVEKWQKIKEEQEKEEKDSKDLKK